MNTIIKTIYTRICKEQSIGSLKAFKTCSKGRHSMAREIFVYYILTETGFTLDRIEAEFGWVPKVTVRIQKRSIDRINYQTGYKDIYNKIKDLIDHDLITMTPVLSELQQDKLQSIKQKIN